MTSCPVINQNEGKTDRMIRLFVGFAALGMGYYYLNGTAQNIAYFVGLVSLVTGYLGFCGLYSLFGITTKGRK